MADNGAYPSPAIQGFTGAFRGKSAHGSLRLLGKLNTRMDRALEGAVVKKKETPEEAYVVMLPTAELAA